MAKKAILLAQLAHNKDRFAPNAVHGMTFIATPHEGSAYLSSNEFSASVEEVMRLRWPIPDSLQQQFRPGNSELGEMAERFKEYSTDIRIYTYYETKDSDLAFMPANDDETRSYHVPITSVASAIMDLEHESETPLASDHVGCATFEGDEEAYDFFVHELRSAVQEAVKLSKIKNCDVDLEAEVKVEVNGFFEDNTSTVKLWTARPTFVDFLAEGPRAHLEARLKQSQGSGKPPPVKALQAVPKRQATPISQSTEPNKGSTPKPPAKAENELSNHDSQRQPSREPRPFIRSSSDSRLLDSINEAQAGVNPDQTEPPRVAPPHAPSSSVRFSVQSQPGKDRRSSAANPGPHLPALS